MIVDYYYRDQAGVLRAVRTPDDEPLPLDNQHTCRNLIRQATGHYVSSAVLGLAVDNSQFEGAPVSA